MDKSALLKETISLMLQLRDAGYDTGLMGAIGEIYAEVKLDMKKAERGAKGFDGWINGRKVSVKSKERVANPSVVYAEVRDSLAGLAHDLLLVQMNEKGELIYYLASFSKLKGKKRESATRYYFNEIIDAAYDSNDDKFVNKAESKKEKQPKSNNLGQRIKVIADDQEFESLNEALRAMEPVIWAEENAFRKSCWSKINRGLKSRGEYTLNGHVFKKPS